MRIIAERDLKNRTGHFDFNLVLALTKLVLLYPLLDVGTQSRLKLLFEFLCFSACLWSQVLDMEEADKFVNFVRAIGQLYWLDFQVKICIYAVISTDTAIGLACRRLRFSDHHR